MATFIWLKVQENLWEKSLDEKQEFLPIQFDPETGVNKVLEDEKAIKDRTKKFHLNVCEKCNTNNQKILKYYDAFARPVPITKFIVKCECGNLSKIHPNIYLAVWSWNKLNKNSDEKL